MYSSNGNNANYNIQKSTYTLFKDIVILDYRKPETGSKSTTFIFYDEKFSFSSSVTIYSFLFCMMGFFFSNHEKTSENCKMNRYYQLKALERWYRQ